MIALHFDDPYRPLPTKLAFRDFTPLPGMVEAQFEQFLASHALQWEPVPSLWWDDSQHTYQLQGAEHRCQIVFTGDLQPFTLAGIYVSAL